MLAHYQIVFTFAENFRQTGVSTPPWLTKNNYYIYGY